MWHFLKPYWLHIAMWSVAIIAVLLLVLRVRHADRIMEKAMQLEKRLEYETEGRKIEKQVRETVRGLPNDAKRDFLRKGTDDFHQ